jgi:hypothetical protein
MISSKTLKDIVSEARPIIERQIDDAERISGFREVVASAGGDWGALKALIKAQIQDERDETGDGKRVKKILDKAEFATGYADMLSWSKMNENNFSAEEEFDPITGEFLEDEQPETANETPKQVYGDSGAEATALPSQSVNIPAGGDEASKIDGSDEQCPADNNQPETAAFQAKANDEACETGPYEGRAEASADASDGVELVSRVVDGRTSTATSEGMDATAGETALNSEIATASQGEAEAPSVERVSPAETNTGSAAANTGGDHEVAVTQSFAAQAGASVQVAPAAKLRIASRELEATE